MKSKCAWVELPGQSASCEPVLQSSTEHWGAQLALSSAAVHW